MLLSRFLWINAVAMLAACGDDGDASCGPGDAPLVGITVAGGATTLEFGSFQAGANNDCPETGAPDGVVSLTVFGTQTSPAGTAFVSVCVPRPDRADGELDVIGDTTGDPRVQLIDLQGDLGAGCRWTLDETVAPTGTATFAGVCAGGTDARGFAMTLAIDATVSETCPETTPVARAVTVTGTVAVTPQ